jgi:GNAT superfamily N-acetyltransferase
MGRTRVHGYEIDDDRSRVDVDVVHRFLAEDSYWATQRTRELNARLVAEASRVVGVYDPSGAQVAFARVVSDDATIAWLADVFVLPEHRGHGLGVALVRETVERGPHANLRWLLGTRDAHELYARFGFGVPSERILERPRGTRVSP